MPAKTPNGPYLYPWPTECPLVSPGFMTTSLFASALPRPSSVEELLWPSGPVTDQLASAPNVYVYAAPSALVTVMGRPMLSYVKIEAAVSELSGIAAGTVTLAARPV